MFDLDDFVDVLVYGSLRPGMYNFKAFKNMYTEIEEKEVVNLPGYELYSLGSYPCVVKTADKSKIVKAQVISVPRNAYLEIKRMEIGAGYVELKVPIPNGKGKLAFFYVYLNKPSEGRSKVVKGGDWVKYKKPIKLMAHD